jgi:hypothetical protein
VPKAQHGRSDSGGDNSPTTGLTWLTGIVGNTGSWAYQIGNVLTLDTLGEHHYNDSALGAVKNLVGLSDEHTQFLAIKDASWLPQRRVNSAE